MSRPAAAALAPPSRDPIVAAVPVFYGWVMLPIAVAGVIATSPGQTYGISAFNESFRDALDLSHTTLAAAYLLGTAIAAPALSFIGGLMDRFGIRRVMTLVVLLFGGTCIATSQVSGLFTLFCAFLLLRMLGQGALTLLSSNTLAMWFHDRLGMASGIMSVGTAAAFAVVPPLNLLLIDQLGWRWAYVVLGLAVWVVMLPLLLIFYRNRPEDIGQVPDGAVVVVAEVVNAAADAVPESIADPGADDVQINTLYWSLTLGEAMQSRAYWILMLLNASWAFVGTGLVFDIVDLFESRGLTEADVALFFTCFAVSMAGAQFVGGFLADRLRLNLLMFASMLGTAVSVAYLTAIDDAGDVVVFAVGQGCSQGLYMVLGQTVWARFFGRAHLGKIRGTVWTAAVAGSSVGPLVMGVTKDHVGNYLPAIWLFAGLNLTLAVAALFVTAPRQQPQPVR